MLIIWFILMFLFYCIVTITSIMGSRDFQNTVINSTNKWINLSLKIKGLIRWMTSLNSNDHFNNHFFFGGKVHHCFLNGIHIFNPIKKHRAMSKVVLWATLEPRDTRELQSESTAMKCVSTQQLGNKQHENTRRILKEKKRIS